MKTDESMANTPRDIDEETNYISIVSKSPSFSQNTMLVPDQS